MNFITYVVKSLLLTESRLSCQDLSKLPIILQNTKFVKTKSAINEQLLQHTFPNLNITEFSNYYAGYIRVY